VHGHAWLRPFSDILTLRHFPCNNISLHFADVLQFANIFLFFYARPFLYKLAFHGADMDIDILATILATMSVSVSVSASWNASYISGVPTLGLCSVNLQ